MGEHALAALVPARQMNRLALEFSSKDYSPSSQSPRFTPTLHEYLDVSIYAVLLPPFSKRTSLYLAELAA